MSFAIVGIVINSPGIVGNSGESSGRIVGSSGRQHDRTLCNTECVQGEGDFVGL